MKRALVLLALTAIWAAGNCLAQPGAAGNPRGVPPALRQYSPDAFAFFPPVTPVPKAPDADGFIQRWLLLEPIDKPNRTNTVFADNGLCRCCNWVARGASAPWISLVIPLTAQAIRTIGRRYQRGGLEAALFEKQRPGLAAVLDDSQKQRIIANGLSRDSTAGSAEQHRDSFHFGSTGRQKETFQLAQISTLPK